MGNFKQVTPFLHVPDVDAAVHFFVEIFGFRAEIQTPEYAYVSREGVGLRMMRRPAQDGAALPQSFSEFAYYIDIASMDDFLREVQPKLTTLPPADVYGPVDQTYGQRELMVRAPDGRILVFGQHLFRAPGV